MLIGLCPVMGALTPESVRTVFRVRWEPMRQAHRSHLTRKGKERHWRASSCARNAAMTAIKHYVSVHMVLVEDIVAAHKEPVEDIVAAAAAHKGSVADTVVAVPPVGVAHKVDIVAAAHKVSVEDIVAAAHKADIVVVVAGHRAAVLPGGVGRKAAARRVVLPR